MYYKILNEEAIKKRNRIPRLTLIRSWVDFSTIFGAKVGSKLLQRGFGRVLNEASVSKLIKRRAKSVG